MTAGCTTVVIPNYNGIAFLEECLSSLEGYPVIVVDNGSTDGSVDYIRQHFPAVQLICNEENLGFCKASNQGMAAAGTPYVFLLNNDTRTEKGCIEALERRMSETPDCFSVQAKMLQKSNPDLIDDAGDLYCALGWAFALGKGKHRDAYKRTAHIFAACGGAVMYRMKFMEITGVFDEEHFAYLEDMDLGYRARILGYKNLMEPKAIVYHAGSGFSGSRYNAFKVDLSSRNSVYLYCKNMPFLQGLINLPFFLLGTLVKTLFFAKKGLAGTYVKGVGKGLKLGFCKAGRTHHVAFKIKYLKNYVKIQLELWWNMIRRLTG